MEPFFKRNFQTIPILFSNDLFIFFLGWRHFRRRRRPAQLESGSGGARVRSSNDCHRSVITHGRGSSYVTTSSGHEIVDVTNAGAGNKGYESKSWRSVYQSRRMHGDVICQVNTYFFIAFNCNNFSFLF